MIDYRYALIRFVPDQHRMEPINVGIILQGAGRLDVRFSPHAAKRKDIDTEIFRQWKEFFDQEIHGSDAPLFQPSRCDAAFLSYLENLCQGSVVLSRPLRHSADLTRDFDRVLDSLYERLVAPPEIAPALAARPTGRFRQLAENGRFVERGMRKHAHVIVGDQKLWMAYRQLTNGELLAFDKVEVAHQIGSTSYEIERLPLIKGHLPRFLSKHVNGKSTRYVLLADELQQPFTDQTESEFAAMRDDLETAITEIRKLDCEIIRSVSDAERFADAIDANLPPHTTRAASTL